MNNRFKFRAWDGNAMRYGGFSVHATSEIENTFLNSELKIVMQCTGLKDKNGKLIYEGDIIREDLSSFADDDGIFVWAVGYDESRAMFIEHNGDKNPLGEIDMDNCEIIGNIYESKHLLKSKS